MSKTKSYNQIIFLTTLSVYLGLVLVGASPQVLAQAALTSKFDIKDQIEKKDDLDKKPNENDLFATEINKLVTELNSLSEKKVFDWELKNHYEIEGLGFCESDNSPSFLASSSFKLGPEGSQTEISLAIDNIAVEIAQNILKRKRKLGFKEHYSQSIDYNLAFEGKTLEIKLGIENKTETVANLISKEFTTYLHQLTSSKRLPKEKLIAENTTVTAENNQVFIVTRLPRAAIDSLINAKQ
jgi:hypothetical protein